MQSRGFLALMPRTRKGLVLFWTALFMLSIALQYAAAAVPQNALALSGALFTSNQDATEINDNIYAFKTDVYLTGGPCQGGSFLEDGDYYFQVTDPSGATLLSSDTIAERKFTVVNGDITSETGSHLTFATACADDEGISIQLMPYDDTPNNGGEYKLTVATAASVAACAGFLGTSDTFIFCTGADQKSDNYKVGDTGDLKITKTVNGGPQGFSGSFPVSIDCGEDGSFSGTIEFPTPGFITIAGIAAGADCTVTEGALPAAPAGYSWGPVSYTNNPVEIDGDGTVNVGVVNTLNLIHVPGIHIEKTASPTALGVGGGSVTYTFVVTNTGNVPLSTVSVADNKCAPVTGPAAGGDANSNNLLDLTESWTFTCTTSITAETTNIGTATGHDGETTVTDTDDATVTVVVDAPAIHVEKTASVAFLAAGGGSVTYTFVVTNVGNVPLSSVSVADNKCSPVTGPAAGGDANSNSLLDLTESWTFSCTATITATTTNIGTATGHDGETTVTDTDDATVTVGAGGVEAETNVPTAPRTDTLGSTDNTTAGFSLLLVLLALAGLAFAIFMVTPMPKSIRNRSSRR